MKRSLAVAGLLLILADSAVLAQLCTESIILPVSACPAATDCTTKGAPLTPVEAEAAYKDVALICASNVWDYTWPAVAAGFLRSDSGGVLSIAAIADADVPDTITVNSAAQALAGDSATAFFSTGTIEAARLPDLSGLNGSVTDAQVPNTITISGTASKCARYNASGNLEAATGDCASGDTAGGGTVTIQEVDGAPSVASAVTLKVDQADGFVLTDEGSGVARLDFTGGGGSSAWTTVKKATDEARNSTITLANDSALTLAMTSGTTYVVRGFVFYNTAATPDFKYGFVGPTGALVFHQRNYAPGAATMGFGSNGVNSAYPTNQVMTGGTGVGMVEFYLRVAATSTTTFAFQWAQDVSNASDTTVYAGSYLEWTIP